MTTSETGAIIKTQGDTCGNRYLPMVEPRRLPLHTVRKRRELSSQTPVIRLVVADGSLLFIVQIQHERHDTGDGAQGSKDS